MRIRTLLLIAGLLLPTTVSVAQSPRARRTASKELPASAHKLSAISVKGAHAYSPAEVIAASGLKTGETVGEDDFKRAAEMLGATGAFTDVVYSYSYSSEGTKLELQVTENDKLVPAVFENFVWFQGKELADKIHRYVPLFRGELPVSGNMVDAVADALQALLVERGSKGHVDYLRSGPEGKSIDSILFSVTGVQIQIRNTDFPGASSADLPLLATAARKLPGDDYSQSRVSQFANYNLLPVYYQRGYIRAKFATPQATIAQEDAQAIQVDVKLPVDTGPQYNIFAIRWTGNTALTPDVLNPLLHVAPGHIANTVQLKSDLDSVQNLYRRHGYMAVSIEPRPDLDESSHTVAYELKVQEGDLYRMGDIELHGLDSRTTDRMRLAWALHEGDPYDASYPQRFLNDTSNILAPGVKWNISVHESLNPKEKTVDVELRFSPQGSG